MSWGFHSASGDSQRPGIRVMVISILTTYHDNRKDTGKEWRGRDTQVKACGKGTTLQESPCLQLLCSLIKPVDLQWMLCYEMTVTHIIRPQPPDNSLA